jgi:hypothetical protein
MTDLQYLPKASITSNSTFYYKDKTSKEDRIKLSHQFESKLENRHNIMTYLQPHAAIKSEPETYNAFDKALSEANKVQEHLKQKKSILENKREKIEGFVEDRNKMLREKLEREKKELEIVLIRIIKDALKFSKESTPMISMMPGKLTNAINQIKEERGLLNISATSLNLSLNSNKSNTSIKKYESNAFLKALGLDLKNLNPDNIKIDIEKAYSFIKNWKVKNEDISQVIRFKVVNEIMNVEERRSAQKIKKINTKINMYLDKRKNHFNKKDSSHSISTIDKNNLSNTSYFDKKINRSESRSITKLKKSGSPVKSLSHGKRNKILSKETVKKKKILLNAYRHVDKLVGYINQSDELKNNKPLITHFNNIQTNKQYDNITRRLINKNKIATIDYSKTSESPSK